MSASREKQNRQERANTGWVDPRTAREAQQRKQEKRTSVLYGVIAVVFLAVAVAAVIFRTNLIPKTATAATIDGEKYTAAEVDFYFQNAYQGFLSNQNVSYMISYMGLNTSAPLKEQTISEDAAGMMATMGFTGAEKDMSWYDYFLDQALEQMARIQAGLKAAEAEGFAYPAGVQAQYEDSMANLKSSAQASGASMSTFLANNFGPLMTEKIYGEQLLRILKFEAYAGAYSDGLTYSAEELESAYQENPKNYDKASYESVSFSGAAPSTTDEDGNTVEPTEEESEAALAAAKENADALLAAYQEDGGSLEELAETYGGSYTSTDKGSYTGSTVTEWLFEGDHQDGDATVLESGTTYYVVLFHDRFREEYETIDIRHILVRTESGSLTAEDDGYEDEQAQLKADAKAKADELLSQWQSGEATEDSFAALAMQESVDGSKYDGGLYAQVTEGQMVETFNDWCFDPARQAGDTGVVETQFGAHVMYFSGKNLPAWQKDVRDVLSGEDYMEWEESLAADSTVTRSDSGLKYVG